MLILCVYCAHKKTNTVLPNNENSIIFSKRWFRLFTTFCLSGAHPKRRVLFVQMIRTHLHLMKDYSVSWQLFYPVFEGGGVCKPLLVQHCRFQKKLIYAKYIYSLVYTFFKFSIFTIFKKKFFPTICFTDLHSLMWPDDYFSSLFLTNFVTNIKFWGGWGKFGWA